MSKYDYYVTLRLNFCPDIHFRLNTFGTGMERELADVLTKLTGINYHVPGIIQEDLEQRDPGVTTFHITALSANQSNFFAFVESVGDAE